MPAPDDERQTGLTAERSDHESDSRANARDERWHFSAVADRTAFPVPSGSAHGQDAPRGPLLDARGASGPAPNRARRQPMARWRPRVVLRRALAFEVERGTAFLLTPVALGAGAVTYHALPVEPALHNAPAALAVLAPVALLAMRRRAVVAVRFTLVMGMIFVAGLIIAQAKTRIMPVQMLGSPVNTTLTGLVRMVEPRADGSARYTLDILETQRPRLRYAPEQVRVSLRGAHEPYVPGTVVQGRVRLMPASGPVRPGGFDFAHHAYFLGLGANGFFFGAPDILASHPVTGGLAQSLAIRLQAVRLWLSERVRAAAPGQGGAVASALITGETLVIAPEVSDMLRLSGLAHILSISGLHMALVAGGVMTAMRAGMALFPVWAATVPVKKRAAGVAVAVALLYLFIAGASVATQRSFIMLSVMLGALMADRAAITMRNLALAALIVIALEPHSVSGPSFQMSFAATAALIAAYASWSSWQAGRARGDARVEASLVQRGLRGFGTFFAGLSATSLIAGAATGIFAVYHFHRIAPYGLIANLLAVPVVSLVTMPLAVIGVAAIPFGLDQPIFRLMAWSVDAVIAIADGVVARSPDAVVGRMPTMAMLLASAGLLALCFLQSRLKLVGVVLLALAAIPFTRQAEPLLVVSEDARQLAVLIDGPGGVQLAVNRPRPNAFIVEQWQAAYRAGSLVKPGQPDGMACIKDAGCRMIARHRAMHLDIAYLERWPEPEGQAAYQANALPTARGAMPNLCLQADVIIHAYSPSRTQCAQSPRKPLELRAQDLALRGAAEIVLAGQARREAQTPLSARLVVHHALEGPLRPWSRHRQYERAARNLAPWSAD